MSCTDIRTQIDRLLQTSGHGSEQSPSKIRAHTQLCEQCAEYLERTEQVEQLLQNLPDIEPNPDLCHRVMQQLTEQEPEQVPHTQPCRQPAEHLDPTEQV